MVDDNEHKHIKGLSAGVLICVALMLAGCVSEFIPESIEIECITTDKDTYHSNDIMNITVVLKSSTDVDDVYINVSGIRNKRGGNLLFKETVTNLTSGLNNVTFIYKTPACSSCSGIDPGTYHFNTSVVYGNETVANATYSVFLEQ